MNWNTVATKLEGLAKDCGLNALDFVPDDMPNTAFYVGEMDITPNQSFNKRNPTTGHRMGTDQANITCRVLVARSDDKYAIRKMRDYLNGSGDQSLIEAIQETNGQPGMPWTGIKVTALRGNRLFVVGEAKFYGTEIELFVTGAA
jgi:hypothetical protein